MYVPGDVGIKIYLSAWCGFSALRQVEPIRKRSRKADSSVVPPKESMKVVTSAEGQRLMKEYFSLILTQVKSLSTLDLQE